MRVIAGSARGCALSAPKGLATRPTTDRLKENLFNLLSPYIKDACFLDLYSGSGAIGVEALSRGAREAVLVESSPEALAVIRENLRKTRLSAQAEIIPWPASRALRSLARDGKIFDIIFMDPPYAGTDAAEVVAWLEHEKILAQDGLLVVECAAQTVNNRPWVTKDKESALALINSRVYGHTVFDLFRWDEQLR